MDDILLMSLMIVLFLAFMVGRSPVHSIAERAAIAADVQTGQVLETMKLQKPYRKAMTCYVAGIAAVTVGFAAIVALGIHDHDYRVMAGWVSLLVLGLIASIPINRLASTTARNIKALEA